LTERGARRKDLEAKAFRFRGEGDAMGRWFPVRSHARVSTHLDGVLEDASGRRAVTVVSLSEGGCHCEGFDLEEVGERLELSLSLDPAGPSWSPRPAAGGWRSRMLAGLPVVDLRLECEVLYRDTAARERDPEARLGLGLRFVDVAPRTLDELRDFVARETFRAREWRTAGGAVPVARLGEGRSEPRR
jgi:hypothetical protein